MQLFGLEKQMLNFEGKPFSKSSSNPTLMKYKDAILMVLEADPIPGQYTPEAKEIAYKLCERLSTESNGSSFDMTVSEVALIKERAGVVASPLAMGRILAFLDNNNEDKN